MSTTPPRKNALLRDSEPPKNVSSRPYLLEVSWQWGAHAHEIPMSEVGSHDIFHQDSRKFGLPEGWSFGRLGFPGAFPFLKKKQGVCHECSPGVCFKTSPKNGRTWWISIPATHLEQEAKFLGPGNLKLSTYEPESSSRIPSKLSPTSCLGVWRGEDLTTFAAQKSAVKAFLHTQLILGSESINSTYFLGEDLHSSLIPTFRKTGILMKWMCTIPETN